MPSLFPRLGALLLVAAASAAIPTALAGSEPGARDRADALAVREAGLSAIVEEAAPPITGATEVSRAADGLFYVNATVNGQSIRFLVDTGASVVVLTAADARRLGVAPGEGRYNAAVETVGGSAAMAWTRLDHVAVAGREVREVRAAIVRGGLGVSLLGQNILSRMGSVTIAGDRLSLR